MLFDKELYTEAIAALRKAAEEADQADAILRDLNCREGADVKEGGRWYTLPEEVRRLGKMVQELESWNCDECGLLMARHGQHCGEAA